MNDVLRRRESERIWRETASGVFVERAFDSRMSSVDYLERCAGGDFSANCSTRYRGEKSKRTRSRCSDGRSAFLRRYERIQDRGPVPKGHLRQLAATDTVPTTDPESRSQFSTTEKSGKRRNAAEELCEECARVRERLTNLLSQNFDGEIFMHLDCAHRSIDTGVQSGPSLPYARSQSNA